MLPDRSPAFLRLLKALKIESDRVCNIEFDFPAGDYATIIITKVLTEDELGDFSDFIEMEKLTMKQLGETTYILEEVTEDLKETLVERLNETLENS
jgi:hypothetical protein